MNKVIGCWAISLVFSSCTFLLGIRDPQPLDPQTMKKFNQKFKIQQYYAINPDSFLTVYGQQAQDTGGMIFDNLYQPLQLIVFDRDAHNLPPDQL